MDTGPVALARPCFPGSQSASSCLWSRTVLPPLTLPLGPSCFCDHGRPAWSTVRPGTRLQCWAEPQTDGPLVLSPHRSPKLLVRRKKKIQASVGESLGGSRIFWDQFILTRGVGVAGLLGLVPDSHTVILQFEVALLLPGTRFDFPQYGAYLHRLDVIIPPDTSNTWTEDQSIYARISYVSAYWYC